MDWLFLIFAVLTLVPALLTATSRNPVNAAMNMIVSFVGLAVLMVLLETYFLAILQVLVYAGAIVVLFLFIIMLIDAEKAPRPGRLRSLAASAAFLLLTVGVFSLFFGSHAVPAPELPADGLNERRARLWRGTLHPLHAALPDRWLHAPHRNGRGDRHQQATEAGYGGVFMSLSFSSPAILAGLDGGFQVGLNHYLFVAGMLFAIGLFGVLLRRNTLVIFMCLELMLSASILALVAFSRYHSTPENPLYSGNVFVLFIIAIAACEVAVGLAIIVAFWRRKQTVDVAAISELKN